MLYTSKSDFVRRSDVNCETSYYEMMKAKFSCLTLVNQVLYDKMLQIKVAKTELEPWTTVATEHS